MIIRAHTLYCSLILYFCGYIQASFEFNLERTRLTFKQGNQAMHDNVLEFQSKTSRLLYFHGKTNNNSNLHPRFWFEPLSTSTPQISPLLVVFSTKWQQDHGCTHKKKILLRGGIGVMPKSGRYGF